MYIEDKSPPPQTLPRIECSSGQNVVVSFEQSPAPDVAYYKIYFSKNLDLKSASEINVEKEIVNIGKIESSFPVCSIMAANDGLLYKKGNRYYYALKLVPEGQYYLSVSPVDLFGNEADEFQYAISATTS